MVGITSADAYELFVTEIDQPYEVVQIESDEYNKQVHLGELNGFPVMYEFSSDSKFELSVQLSEASNGGEPVGFSLMIVRQNDDDGGVTEIVRQMASDNKWTTVKDPVYGMNFIEGEVLKKEFGPGTYRLEVSTPVNKGKFMLTIGSESDPLGYFATINRVWVIQDHFGYSFLRILASSYVYYPLGILFLLFLIHRTWKYRNSISHVA